MTPANPDPLDPSLSARNMPADTEDTSAPSRGVDVFQLVFWLALLVAVGAALVAILRPDAVGRTGPVLLIAIAAGLLVSLVWMLKGAGRRLGYFPGSGAGDALVRDQPQALAWIDALDEPALVTEGSGGCVAANAAFDELTRMVGVSPDPARPVAVDRLFGAHPGLNAPLFRLARAARAGKVHAESLPPVALGQESQPVRFDISVAPLRSNRALWRVRRRETPVLTSAQETDGGMDLYIEDAPVGFFMARGTGVVTYMNAFLRDRLGLPRDIGRTRVDDILTTASVKSLRRDRRATGPIPLDLTFQARNGVETRLASITNWSGKGADALSRTFVIEPTGLRPLMQTTPRPVRADANPVFEASPVAEAMLEGETLMDARILDANPAFVELSDGMAVPGTVLASLFGDVESASQFAERLPVDSSTPVEFILAADVPTPISLQISKDASGRPVHAYLFDLSKMKELELRVAHGEKMQSIGTLVGGVAHDFNNMLTGIMLACDTLLQRHSIGDPSFEGLQTINQYSARGAELVSLLQAFSRKQTLKQDILNITDLLSEFRVMVVPMLGSNIEMKIVHGSNLPLVRADKTQISNALFNLATNARDAMRETNGGTLKIVTRRASTDEVSGERLSFMDSDECLCIEFSDTGTGMPPEVLEKIFEPFYTTKDPGKGTGFGLANVRGIVNQSKGDIIAFSKIGEGTTFRIYLPPLPGEDAEAYAARQAAESAKGGDHRPRDMAGRGRIMLVEDEDAVRSLAANFLTSRGYHVIEAEDGEAALEILEQGDTEIDLLISDVAMPGIDGPSLVIKAEKWLGSARVLFISGYTERDLSSSPQDKRPTSFLSKPFTMTQFAERVKEELQAG